MESEELGALTAAGSLTGTEPVHIVQGGESVRTTTQAIGDLGGSSWTYVTAQATTSGTAFDFTSIPAGTSEIVVFLYECSLSGTDDILIQFGDSGGVETTGYEGDARTNGLRIFTGGAANVVTGGFTLIRADSAGTEWYSSTNSSYGTAGNPSTIFACAMRKVLSAELDRIRLTRSGTNTFDAGSVHIKYR